MSPSFSLHPRPAGECQLEQLQYPCPTGGFPLIICSTKYEPKGFTQKESLGTRLLTIVNLHRQPKQLEPKQQ